MPRYRAISKLTGRFKKGTKKVTGKAIRRYMGRYADERGKALANAKRGLPSEHEAGKPAPKNPAQETPILTGVEGRSGILWSGGFLKEERSPGAGKPRMQSAWIRRKVALWLDILEGHNRRTSDGHRFVVSLSPEDTHALVSCGIPPEEALREIWSTTMELYKKKHKWEKEELGWLAGIHHDTDNVHMHFLLFPTTKTGIPLRTSNARKDGDKRVDDLDEITGMVNQAAEIYWRSSLPLEHQTPEYQMAVALGEELPELPDIADYQSANPLGKGKKIPFDPERQKRIEASKLKDKEIEKQAKEFAKMRGAESLRDLFKSRRILPQPTAKDSLAHREETRKARHMVKDLDAEINKALKAKAEKEDSKFPPLFMALSKADAAIHAKLQSLLAELYPEQHADLKTLEEACPELQGDFATMLDREEKRTQSLVELILGSLEYLPRSSVPDAIIFHNEQKHYSKTTDAKRVKALEETMSQALSEWQKRWLFLRRLELAIHRSRSDTRLQQIKKLLAQMKAGAKILMLAALGRVKEIRAFLDPETEQYRKEKLEWEVQGKELVHGESEGAPWPDYLDPAEISAPVDIPEPTTRTPEETLKEIENLTKSNPTNQEKMEYWEKLAQEGVFAKIHRNRLKNQGGMN
jgi:hypothetical protein